VLFVWHGARAAGAVAAPYLQPRGECAGAWVQRCVCPARRWSRREQPQRSALVGVRAQCDARRARWEHPGRGRRRWGGAKGHRRSCCLSHCCCCSCTCSASAATTYRARHAACALHVPRHLLARPMLAETGIPMSTPTFASHNVLRSTVMRSTAGPLESSWRKFV